MNGFKLALRRFKVGNGSQGAAADLLRRDQSAPKLS
jgi:hypothetical protein